MSSSASLEHLVALVLLHISEILRITGLEMQMCETKRKENQFPGFLLKLQNSPVGSCILFLSLLNLKKIKRSGGDDRHRLKVLVPLHFTISLDNFTNSCCALVRL